MNEWTIQKLLTWITEYLTKNNVDAPRLSAELLLSHVLECKRIDLYTQYTSAVAKEHLDRLNELVKRAGKHEPVALVDAAVGVDTHLKGVPLQMPLLCALEIDRRPLFHQKAGMYCRRTAYDQREICVLCG